MTTTIHIQGILLDDMSATLWDKADGWTDGVGGNSWVRFFPVCLVLLMVEGGRWIAVSCYCFDNCVP